MDVDGTEGEQAARILFVCHANHCRSPMMELLLRAVLEPDAGLLVSSAGTYARPGLPAHPYAVQALAEHGVDASGWRSTRLDAETVDGADLIVTAAAEQRHDVVAMVPSAADRTFTLLDLAAWLEAVPPSGAGKGVPGLLLQAATGRARLGKPTRERDLPDPMGRGLRQFRLCRRRVEAALVPFQGALRPISPGAPRGRRA
jgi:protein-tyrosine phosphatase